MGPEDVIETYSPRPDKVDEATWRRLRPHVVAAVRKAPASSPVSTQNRLAFVARYMQWCEANDIPLQPDVIWTEDRIESYLTTARQPSVSTYRPHLRAVAKANAPSSVVWNVNPETYPRNSNRSFYTPAQVRQLLTLIDVQATPRRSFLLSATLHLGLALGLRAPELLTVRQGDITQEDGLVLCRTAGRVVPARAVHARGVLDVVRSTDDDLVFGDHLLPSRNHDHLSKDIEFPPYLPKVTPARLRNTWILDVLSDAT